MSTTKEEFIELAIPKEFFQGTGNLLDEPVLCHSTSHFKLVEDLGALRYIDGALYPAKGIPTPEAVFAINQIKSLIKEGVKYLPFLIFADRNKLLTSFNTLTNRFLNPYKVDHKYLCPTAFSMYTIIARFLVNIGIDEEIAENTAYNIAHIFEYDDAWRYRMQDIAHEANINNFYDNPSKELKRLTVLFCNRQDLEHRNVISDKVERLIKPLHWILLLPKYRNSFLNIIIHIKGMDYDESDEYWMKLRDDYNFFGKTTEERIAGMVIPPRYRV